MATYCNHGPDLILQALHLNKVILVPMERLELSRYYYRGILNPLRLPFRHIGQCGPPNAVRAQRQSVECNFLY